MKTNKIVLEQKYKSKAILFKVIPYKSYKSPNAQKTQMNLNSTFDFNNNKIDTIDEYKLIMHNDLDNDDFNTNSINNGYFEEEIQNSKLV